jgi:hypothetical protein
MDPDAKPSATACISYTTHSVNDNLYACANGINNGKYAYNNLQQYDATWYHKFSKSVHLATETWYMYERDVPAVGGSIQPETGANAAYCFPGEQRCTAPEYAAVSYLQKGAFGARFSLLSSRLSRRQERPAHGLCDQVLREHRSWFATGSAHGSDSPGATV